MEGSGTKQKDGPLEAGTTQTAATFNAELPLLMTQTLQGETLASDTSVLKDIGQQWMQQTQGKRKRKSRLKKKAGQVDNVLAVNDYSLGSNISVFDASGEQAGPVSASELQRKFKSGELNADCMAWKEGMAEWTPISKLPELAATAAAKTACECCSCSDSQVAVARFLTAAPPCFRWLRQHGVDAGHDEDKKPGARREEGGCP